MRCGVGVQQRSGLPRRSAKPAAQVSLIAERENRFSIKSVCQYQLTEKLRKFILKKILQARQKIFSGGIGKHFTLLLH